jgi:acetyl-CoA carboxylase biotin carboxyl carrier protein
MPQAPEPPDRTPEQRAADHASLASLAEALVPALVAKLNASGLGELEVREGDWHIRVRRPAGAGPATSAARRPERPWAVAHAPDRDGRPGRDAAADPHPETRPASPAPGPVDDGPTRVAATSPAVGIFRPSTRPGSPVTAGDRIGIVDLLGIPQDVIAPIDGVLIEVLVDAGSAVEYGEPVATVEGRRGTSPNSASPGGEG